MRCGKKINWSKKIYRGEFLQTSFKFVIYLFKEDYRKIISEIYFEGKTRYEDLTETGYQLKFHNVYCRFGSLGSI